MSTRNFFFSILLVFSFQMLFAQDNHSTVIKQQIQSFIDLQNQGEWDRAFDYMYPKLFAKVPKQELVAMMDQMDSGMKLMVANTELTSTSVPIEEGNETFVRVEITSDMTFSIIPDGMFDAPKPIMGLDEQFKATYGKTNVRWDAEKKEFAIRAHKAMMAIKNGNQDWKLVEINMDQPELMEYLFSPSIMDALVRVE